MRVHVVQCCGSVFALRPLALSCALLQVPNLMLWICTTVQQGHGQRLSSAWHANFYQPHRSGTLLCLLGDIRVRCCEGCCDMSWALLMVCEQVECLDIVQYCGANSSATACFLMRAAAGPNTATDVVDLYNSATGTWSTAQLSLARWALAAASIGNLALFGGGRSATGELLCRKAGRVGVG